MALTVSGVAMEPYNFCVNAWASSQLALLKNRNQILDTVDEVERCTGVDVEYPTPQYIEIEASLQVALL
jgi:pyridoxine/pyridoxamine 5'-phosphate oxidase